MVIAVVGSAVGNESSSRLWKKNRYSTHSVDAPVRVPVPLPLPFRVLALRRFLLVIFLVLVSC